MSSPTSQAASGSRKTGPSIKGIIRKRLKGKKILIIIDNTTYFITFTAIQNVWNDVNETSPIYGY